jgi:hypothetical protein
MANNKQIGTAGIGLIRMSQGVGPSSEQRAIQDGIDEGLRGAIADARRRNPNALDPSVKVKVMGAAPGIDGPQPIPGWYEPKPLASPPGVGIIDRLVQEMQPHGPKSKAK